MNQKLKVIISILLTAVFFGVVIFMYNTLKEDYAPDVLNPPVTEGESGEEYDSTYGYVDAPDFTVTDAEGNSVKLSDYFGQPIVLNFWATWCYYCKEEMPDFERAQKENPDVKFLMINSTDGVRETVDIAKKYIADQGFTFEVLFDTEGMASYQYYITGLPSTFFINADGRLVTYANSMLTYDDLIRGIGFVKGE